MQTPHINELCPDVSTCAQWFPITLYEIFFSAQLLRTLFSPKEGNSKPMGHRDALGHVNLS
jgi:hypothetical protein